MTAKRKKTKDTVHIAGRRGVNRVRVYDRGEACLYWDFVSMETGERVRTSMGHGDRARAKAEADTLAAEMLKQTVRVTHVTVGSLFDMYRREVTPQKGLLRQQYDRRTLPMLEQFFGKDTDPKVLSRTEFDRFIVARRSGALRPPTVTEPRTVSNTAIGYDLKLMIAVFNWATTVGDGKGNYLLTRNPFKGLPLPDLTDPQRTVMTSEYHKAVLAVADQVHPYVRPLAIVTRETGRRIGAVRQLQWGDLDLEKGLVTWRAETDKEKKTTETPLTRTAVKALLAHRRKLGERMVIGGAVFPLGEDGRSPSTATVQRWWRETAQLAGLPKGKRLGWHGNRRTWATEHRDVAAKDFCELGGWANYDVPLNAYIKPSMEAMRSALQQRRKLV